MSDRGESEIIAQVSKLASLVKLIVALVATLGVAVFWIAMMQFQLMTVSDEMQRVKLQLEKLTAETYMARERLIKLEAQHR